MNQHTLSILCPSYNHEKYVKFFIDSLLAQTNPNWELVIVDDCSTDNNVLEIEKFKDKRIKLFKNPFNMGINCAINTAFEHSCGDFIAFSASDDMLAKDFVETVLSTFEHNPKTDVIYSNLQIMSHDGVIQQGDIWSQQNYDKFKLLCHMFFIGNIMLSPGMAFRRSGFKQLYPLPIALSQYQDYKIHVDVALKLSAITLDKALVIYRKPSKKSGISETNSKTLRIRQLEENILMDSFLQIKDIAMLKEVFGPDLLQRFGKLDNFFIPYYLGSLALDAQTEYKKVWGYNQIAGFITKPENYALVHKKYGFCYKDFLNLADKFEQSPMERKYIKYKKLFNISIIIICLFIIWLLCGFKY